MSVVPMLALLTFVLHVDTSVKNLISYRSLGRCYNGAIHYAKPRHYNAHPATLITRDEAADLAKIHVSIPDPKAHVNPTTSTPSQKPAQEQPPVVKTKQIADEELLKNTAQPLTSKIHAMIHDDLTALPPFLSAHTAGPEHRTSTSSTISSLIVSLAAAGSKTNNTLSPPHPTVILSTPVNCLLPSTIGDYTTIKKTPRGR